MQGVEWHYSLADEQKGATPPTSYMCGHPDSQWRLSSTSVASVLFAVCYTCSSNYIALAGITVLTGLPVVLSMWLASCLADEPAAFVYIELACRVRKDVFVKAGPTKHVILRSSCSYCFCEKLGRMPGFGAV